MSRPSTTMPPSPIAGRCSSSRRARTSGTALTGLTAAFTSSAADRRGDVVAVDGDRRRRAGRCRSSDLGLAHAGRHRVRVVHVDAVAQHPPGHRAEHRTGVEVAQPEPVGDAARRARLAGPEGPSIATTTCPWVCLSTRVVHGRETTGGRSSPSFEGGEQVLGARLLDHSSTSPTGRPGSWSMCTSSMLTPLAPMSANSRASSPGWSGTEHVDRAQSPEPGRRACRGCPGCRRRPR